MPSPRPTIAVPEHISTFLNQVNATGDIPSGQTNTLEGVWHEPGNAVDIFASENKYEILSATAGHLIIDGHIRSISLATGIASISVQSWGRDIDHVALYHGEGRTDVFASPNTLIAAANRKRLYIAIRKKQKQLLDIGDCTDANGTLWSLFKPRYQEKRDDLSWVEEVIAVGAGNSHVYLHY